MNNVIALTDWRIRLVNPSFPEMREVAHANGWTDWDTKVEWQDDDCIVIMRRLK